MKHNNHESRKDEAHHTLDQNDELLKEYRTDA